MKLRAGTSGYAFKEWKGTFYPEDLKDDGMLGFYAGKFPAVEINNTFYRLPKEHVLLDWASRVPDEFTFAIKASQRITHHARLKPECASAVEFLLKNTSCLADRCGPVLFQLPPNLKKDAPRLAAFLDTLPEGRRYTIEFRHDSWFDDETYDALRARHRAVHHGAAGVRVARRFNRKLGICASAPAGLRRAGAGGVGETDPRPAVGRRLRVLQA
jgi:uncharacterized protein YecE (DUF72 family)